ncbi:MAG: hypothetical protein JHD16_13350 [Solirubrobacteraceae bacterium]|nr:hypothetical protein [Solirubrobacteraceae bacterium]
MQPPLLLALAAAMLAALLPVSVARADRLDPTRPAVITLEQRSRDPRAVVLADGTILAQWFRDESDVAGGQSRVLNCRIPAGASACEGAPQTMLGGGPRTSSELIQPAPSSDPDHVYSVTSRLQTPGMVHWVRESLDGGRTWGAAVQAATNTGQQLGGLSFIHGPGAFRFSSLADGWFQAGTYDGTSLSTLPAKLIPNFAPSSTTFWQGLGRSESTTPVVAFHTDQYDGGGALLYSRRFTGAGSVNDAAAWSAPARYAPPRGIGGIVGLASGPRGLFVAFHEKERDGCGPRLVVARYDGVSFGSAVPVDADRHAADVGVDCSYGNHNAPGEPVAFTQDPAGNLRAVWTFNRLGADPTAPDGLYTAVSVDGGLSWTNPIRLYGYADGAALLTLPNTNGTGIASNERGDAVVLGSGSGTRDRGVQLMRLPSLAEALAQPGPSVPGTAPPPPAPVPEPAACTKVKFGAVTALSTVGCWKRSGSTYSSSGPVRINGIDLKPLTGKNARRTFETDRRSTVSLRADRRAIRALRADVTEVLLDAASNTVKTTGAWRAGASAVDLGRQAINWYVPPGGGAVLNEVTRDLARLDASQLPQRVLGLPASGVVVPRFLTNGTAQLPMNLKLPPPLGGLAGGDLTDNITLTTDNGVGIQLSRGAISLELPKVSLGIAEISPFRVTYNADPFVFQGNIGIKLPVIGGGIDASLLIRDGEFVDATAAYTPVPPIPITGFVNLTQVGLHVFKGRSCAEPTGLEISARVAAGPEIAGASLLGIQGIAGYRLPEGACNRPGVFFIAGTGTLVSIPVAKVNLQFTTDGTLTFGAAVALGDESTGVAGSLEGGISFATGDFYAAGKVSVKVFGYEPADVSATLSSYGFGACARIKPIPIPGLAELTPSINAGVAVRFQRTSRSGPGFTFYLANCYIADLTPPVFAKRLQAGGPEVPTVEVAAGTDVETFVAESADGQAAPRFTLVAPGGERIDAGLVRGARTGPNGAIVFSDDTLHQTAVTIRNPTQGSWRLEPIEGSSPIIHVEGAVGGPKPTVSATVVRAGGRGAFSIAYRASMPAQARVTFFDSSGQRLGRPTTTRRGVVRFRSETGKAGRRAVIARVDGPTGTMVAPTVGSFQSPGAAKPGKPRSVRVVRGRRGPAPGMKVTWAAATGAARYLVRAELKDGQLVELETRASRRVATIPEVPGFAAATVRVYAVSTDGRVGTPAVAKAKAVKAKPRKRSTKQR